MALCLPGALILPGRGVGRPNGPTYHAGTHKQGASVLHLLNPGPLLCSAWNVPSHMVVEVTGCYLLAPETRAPRGPTGEDCQHGQDMFGLCVRTPPGSLTTRVSY